MTECAGGISYPAKIKVAVGATPTGRVSLGFRATYHSHDGSDRTVAMFWDLYTPKQARRLAFCIRELVNGNTGDFMEGGLDFMAGEWGGCEIILPSGSHVWLDEDVDIRDMADELDKAAEEAAKEGCE